MQLDARWKKTVIVLVVLVEHSKAFYNLAWLANALATVIEGGKVSQGVDREIESVPSQFEV